MPFTAATGDWSLKILSSGFEQSQILTNSEPARITGPLSWWHGPLDVERLALGSVSLFVNAINAMDAQLLGGAYGRAEIQASQVAAAFGSMAHLRIAGEKTQGFAQHSRFYRCADGWIRTHANYPHHEQRLLRAVGAGADTTLQAALLHHTAFQAQELIVGSGGVAAKVQARKQWLESVSGKAAQEGHWAQFTHHQGTGQQSWTPDPQGNGPLSGLRVLDLTRVIAGPTATRTLAAFGAQVLRIDGPLLPELSAQHIDTGFGKRNTVLDISSSAGKARMNQLLEQADVLICGYRSGSLSRLGFGTEALQLKYPNLIIAELNAWGHDGPWMGRRGFDSIVQAACGIADIYQSEDGSPGALPVQALDHATGHGLAAAMVSLVQARAQTRRVGSVRFSLARTAEALCAFGPPVDSVQEVDPPLLGRRPSAYGILDYALTPFTVNGEPLDFRAAPPAYGQDQPIWL